LSPPAFLADRVHVLPLADLVAVHPALAEGLGVGREPGRDVAPQQRVDVVLDVIAVEPLGAGEQLEREFLLDPTSHPIRAVIR
jgi:hypothetical protein